jgi:hypothetical protein
MPRLRRSLLARDLLELYGQILQDQDRDRDRQQRRAGRVRSAESLASMRPLREHSPGDPKTLFNALTAVAALLDRLTVEERTHERTRSSRRKHT